MKQLAPRSPRIPRDGGNSHFPGAAERAPIDTTNRRGGRHWPPLITLHPPPLRISMPRPPSTPVRSPRPDANDIAQCRGWNSGRSSGLGMAVPTPMCDSPPEDPGRLQARMRNGGLCGVDWPRCEPPALQLEFPGAHCQFNLQPYGS